ncbi:MAG TPA: class I SAM-dependent methyltransferase [Victivallales bacterium]|nr:class I SAM-dependent methyltransferase [Victivallales bacterium]
MLFKKKNKIYTQEIGLELGLNLGEYFLNSEDLHYGFWKEGTAVDIQNMPKAQKDYKEFLISHLPNGCKSILDVGCGSGELAKELLELGYDVDCVSPSAFLGERASSKLSSDVHLYNCKFEDIIPQKKYDLVLFCESFQYIKLSLVFDKVFECLKTDGHIMISDFFKTGVKNSPMGGGHKIKRFEEVVSSLPLEKVKDIDITNETAPTIDLVNKFFQSVALPNLMILKKYMQTNHRIIYKILTSFLKIILFKRVKKLKFKYFSGNRNGDSFKIFKTYRMFIYKNTCTA